MRIAEKTDLGAIGLYPSKGWDFPRGYVSITPHEALTDMTRVLGAPVRMKSLRYTVLRQPRLETTAMRMAPQN